MSYIKFNFNTKELKLAESAIRLYPLACFHIGASQSDYKFIVEHIKRIKNDSNARWVYMGDGGECVTLLSKGDISAQLLNPQLQMEMLCDLLGPVSNKGLFGVRGNHGHRVYKTTGLSFDHNLCSRLGIPYMGAATFAHFSVNRSHYTGYFHHGLASGVAQRSKIAKAEEFGKFIDADMIFTAHSHVAIELHPSALLSCDAGTQKEITKLRHQYICGSGYDSRTGYAEDKGYPPLLPAMLSVELDGRIKQGFAVKSLTCTKYESDGQHTLTHPYLEEYLSQQDID